MNALSHKFDLSLATMLPSADAPHRGGAEPDALAGQWAAVHEAAKAVANLAQLGEEEPDDEVRSLPDRAARLSKIRRELVASGVDDLAAVLQPGMRALIALTAKGQDTTSAALTLWREFHTARSAILSLAETR